MKTRSSIIIALTAALGGSVAPLAGAATITASQSFENDSAGFAAALAGATLVTVDFEALALGVIPAGTVVNGNVAGFSITLQDFEIAVDFGGSRALGIGTLIGVSGKVSFSSPVIGVGATFNSVPGGAFGNAFRGEGFDLTDNGIVGDVGDVAFTSAFSGPTFLGFMATAPFSVVGISSFPPFAVPTNIDNLVFAVAGQQQPPVGAVPLPGVPEPMSLALMGIGLAGLGIARRRRI